MKKSVLAAAVLCGLVSGAHAQSSVTIYGLVDLAVSKGNGGTANNPGGNGVSAAWTMRQSASSRLGFRGSEDLGGGLYAEFNLDHRFFPDTGAANANFYNGKSLVQLRSTTYGTLWFGRDYIPLFFVGVKSDPFGYDGVGSIAVHQFAGYRSTSGTQAGDAVGYRTPSIGGVVASAMISLGEGTKSRANGLTVEYTAGKVYAGFGFEKLEGGAPTVDGDQLVNAAFHYNFDFMKAIVYVARSRTGLADRVDTNLMLGALIPVGPVGRIKAAYSRMDPGGSNNTQQKVGLGYEYFFSKRTDVYFDVGVAREDQKSTNRALAVGIKHLF